jgi:hypothetical protein
MIRAEFIEKNEAQQKRAGNLGKWLLGYLAIYILLFVCMTKYGQSVPDEVRGPISVIGLFAGFFGILVFSVRRATKSRREFGLFCPHCKKDLLGLSFQIVVASVRCGRCGGIVLEDWNK